MKLILNDKIKAFVRQIKLTSFKKQRQELVSSFCVQLTLEEIDIVNKATQLALEKKKN